MAANNLPACLPVTLAYEGGLSMIRADPGNWTGGKVGVGVLRGTNYGIAASSHPALDIANLTRAEAEAIYAREYWTPAGCEALPAGLDLSHFDATVNSGRGRSGKLLAAARKGRTVPDQIHAYADARLSFLHALRTWPRFGKAWGTRVAGVEAKSLRMALGSGAAASALIAQKAAAQASRAKVASASAHGGTATAAASAALATGHHPVVAGGVGLLALISAAALAFDGWRKGLRAAAFTHEAVSQRRSAA